ncbi:MAG: sulfite exporter TauE/SafE family protein [Maricaulaceae bacterium]
MKLSLAFTFLLTAALYASAGFGGGSTYTALLAVSGTPFYVIPIVSLICNICVVAGNCLRYFRAKLIFLSDVWPLLILSIPAAFFGGRLNISEAIFIGLLCLALFIAGARMILSREETHSDPQDLSRNPMICAFIGGAIGFYSGIVGIGGGIFLAPVLYKLRWGRAQEIAAVCSVFILVNSVSGLGGHFIKVSAFEFVPEIISYVPLIIAVLIGGTIGNVMSIRFLKSSILRRITGLLILAVAIRLLIKWVGLVAV